MREEFVDLLLAFHDFCVAQVQGIQGLFRKTSLERGGNYFIFKHHALGNEDQGSLYCLYNTCSHL